MDTTELEDLIDEICDRFEAAWRGGARPRLEDELDAIQGPGRDELLGHLLAVEIAYRLQLGEAPETEEYHRRLPDHGRTVDAAIARARRPPSTDASSSTDDRPDPTPSIPGCEIAGELGRGGMGRVLRGRDPALRRDLAVKVLLERHAARPDIARRFVEEARIGGQLQHPGIVPVYDLGTTGEGRPYFTMKLVRGRTLASLLADRDPPDADLPRFLGIFEQVAQTVAYAHTRGVVHRDLKPSNVMVGKFGEVQVMDWGLAKLLGDQRPYPADGIAIPDRPASPDDEETLVDTGRDDSDENRSRTGSTLGTPAYMAPEQARGETSGIDERADVFALGSILCKILTGEPAYTGRDGNEIFEKAARADLLDTLARLDVAGADPDLVALACRCLAADRDKRLANAGEVAEALATHRLGVEDRLRRAELARVEAQARAEEEAKRRTLADNLAAEASSRAAAERQRRRATLALALASVAALLLLGVGLSWWRTRLASADVLLAEAGSLCDQAEASTDADPSKANAALNSAREALGGLPGRSTKLRELEARVARLTRVNHLVNDLTEVRGNRAEITEVKTKSSVIEGLFRRAFSRFDPGFDLDRIDPAALASQLANLGASVEIAAALDDWGDQIDQLKKPSEYGRRDRLIAAARAIDSDPFRSEIRSRYYRWNAAELENYGRRMIREASTVLRPSTYVLIGMQLARAGMPDLADRVFEAGWSRFPDDFWINYDRAYVLFDPKQGRHRRVEEAERYMTIAAFLRPKSSAAHNGLAIALAELGRKEQAAGEARIAIRLDHDSFLPHNTLSNILREMGRLADAEKEARIAIGLESNLAGPHINLAAVLIGLDRHDEAAREADLAIRLAPEDSSAHVNLGHAFRLRGRIAEAVEEYRIAVDLDPNSTRATAILNDYLNLLGRWDDAIKEFDRRRSTFKDDTALLSRLDVVLASAYANRGNSWAVSGDLPRAIADYEQSLWLQTDNPYRWWIAATLRALAGDTYGHRRHCRGMLTMLGGTTDLQPAFWTVKVCMLRPISDEEQEMACRLARRVSSLVAPTSEAARPYVDLVEAMTDHRGQRFSAAVDKTGKILDRPGPFPHNLAVPALIFRSMALFRLGRFDESRAAFNRGAEIHRSWNPRVPTIDPGMDWYDRQGCGLLLREAEGLLLDREFLTSPFAS